MLMSTGMTYAGAFAASIAAFSSNPDRAATALLSDSLPSAMLYVRLSASVATVSHDLDRAMRNAHLRSVTIVDLI